MERLSELLSAFRPSSFLKAKNAHSLVSKYSVVSNQRMRLTASLAR